MSKTKYAPFDASEFLDNEETIAEYLAAALEDPNPDVFMCGRGGRQGQRCYRRRRVAVWVRKSVQGTGPGFKDPA